MRTILLILAWVLAVVAGLAQQPLTDDAAQLLDAVPHAVSGPDQITGPAVWTIYDPTWSVGVPWRVGGQPGMAFEVYASSDPIAPGSASDQGGIVDLALSPAPVSVRVGTTPVPGPDPEGATWDVATLPVAPGGAFEVAMQGWVTAPNWPAGYRWTNACGLRRL